MMQSGNYYVGDLCYVMHDVWDEVCELIIDGHSCLQGEFELKDGRKFALLNTMYGDGVYFDQQGRKYPVDAGLIGVIKMEDIRDTADNKWVEGGNEITFTRDFEVYRENGVLYFGMIEIDTNGDYNYDDEGDE
jgi:hypothetical protein